MNKRKMSAVCGLGALTLIAGFGLSARPASALPITLSVTRLAAPVLDHEGDAGWNGWQDRQDQDRREYQENQRRDRENRERDRENRRRDAENRRLAFENQRRDRERHDRDNHERGRHDSQGDRNWHRDDNRDNH